MKKKWVLVIITVLAGSGILFTGCQGDSAIKTEPLICAQDLAGHDLFIYNVTCSWPSEMRTVDDNNFLNEVAVLCLKTETLRPVISVDSVAGGRPDALFVLRDAEDKYVFSFFETEKQLDIGFIYRDKPVLCVEKALKNEFGHYETEWAWYCILSASDYASLYELVQTYTDGEIVDSAF